MKSCQPIGGSSNTTLLKVTFEPVVAPPVAGHFGTAPHAWEPLGQERKG